jgi:hypothetical protein
MNRIFSPSPTVRSSSTPAYMRGFPPAGLGQDVIFDPGVPSSPGIFNPVPETLDPLIAQGFTPDEADMIDAAAANGVISDAQFQSILAGNHSLEEVSSMIFANSGGLTNAGVTQPTAGPGALTAAATAGQAASAAAAALKAGTAAAVALGPGASPRVALPAVSPASSVTSALKAASVLPGVPNYLLIGGALLLAMAMGKR